MTSTALLLRYLNFPGNVLRKLLSAFPVVALFIVQCQTFAQTYTSVQSGNWNSAATWGNTGSNYPGNNDNVIISAGTTVTHGSNKTINRLIIQPTGELVSNARLSVNGSYTNNGTHSGSNQVRLQGSNDSISGTGTITTTTAFRVDNKRTILPGSNLTRSGSVLRCPNNDTLFNYGTLVLSACNLNAAVSGSFFNGSSGTLYTDRNVLANGTLIASEAGNRMFYNRTGNGSQSIKGPVNGYYDLNIDGSSLGSIKAAAGAIKVLNDLTISGSTMSLSDTFSLYVGGDLVLSGGAFNPVSGRVLLNGASAQAVSGNFTLPYLYIQNTGSGVTITSDTIKITGALHVNSGTLNTQGRLVIVSDAAGDASIGPVTGVINGDVLVQRYIDAGATNWRFMGSPVQNATFLDWEDDFIMSGFPGSQFPDHFFTSVYSYNETAAGHMDSGFVKLPGIGTSINPGEGYWVFCGDALQGTNPFTIDATGPINQGNFDFNLSYTGSAGGLPNDGWNLVANPYPSAIDWDSPNWSKVNVDGAVYIWNTDLNQYASYVAGLGTNGGSNVIATGQGFYVKANAASPALQVQEAAKVDTTVTFLRQQRPEELIVRLTLARDQDSSETAIRVIPEASRAFDPQYDAWLFPSAGNSVAIGSMTDEREYSINSLSVAESDTIDLRINTPEGHVKLRYEVQRYRNDFCAALWDHTSGATYLLSEQGEFPFDNTGSENRFSLIITRNTAGPSWCEKLLGIEKHVAAYDHPGAYYYDGKIVITENMEGLKGSVYNIRSVDGRIVQQGAIDQPVITLNPGFPAGTYLLEIEHTHLPYLKFISF